MGKTKWLGMFLGLLLTGAAVAEDATPPRFLVVIEAAQPVVKAGAEVRIKITFTNKTETDLTVTRAKGAAAEQAGYKVHVTDLLGDESTDTRYGRHLKGNHTDACPTLFVAAEKTKEQVPPGKSVTDEMIVSGIYDLSKPGSYIVSVERADPASKTTVKSNRIVVTVK